jgi:IS1 family transposase
MDRDDLTSKNVQNGSSRKGSGVKWQAGKWKKRNAKLPQLRIERGDKKRSYSQREAEICVQGLSTTICRKPSMEADFRRNESLNRQAVIGAGGVGRHSTGNWSIHPMVARVRECEIRSTTPGDPCACSKKRRLTVQADEMWSFVASKANQVWLWLAIDVESRLIVGCTIGPRDTETAEDLWYSLPPEYRQRAVCYTDFLQAYARVLPSKRHRAVDKASGKTAYIERLNNTFRQRCSRLVRKTLSFSKKLANHIGAIWYFIHHYNARILAQLDPITTFS